MFNYKDIFEGLSKIALNADRPAAFLETIADFTKADAASLWSNTGTSFANDKFFLVCHTNRPDLKGEEGIVSVNIKKNHVISSKAIKNKKIIRGEIGKEPFTGKWLDKPYTKGLRKLGIKYVIVIPVFDIAGLPINILSLYFKKQPQLASDILHGISEMVTATNEAIEKRLRQSRLERRKDRHEIMFHTRVISSKFHSISKDIKKLEQGGISFRKVSQRASDISRSISILRQSYESSSFRERIEDRYSHTEYIPLGKIVRDTLATTVAVLFKPHEVSQGDVSIPHDIDVLFHPEDLNMLLSNILQNAAKYSVIGSVVRVELLKNGDKGCKLVVRNDIDASIQDDLREIWEYEVRGSAAKKNKVDGEGLGLGMVSDICSVYGITPIAGYQNTDRKHTKVFCLTLEIPFDIISGECHD